MKKLASHTHEALKIGKNLSKFSVYSCRPTSKKELASIIDDRISMYGPDCDLNDIDVILIKDMSGLFCNSIFTGDISKWDVSNVENMGYMFEKSKFNGDISKWDVSKVKNMAEMFSFSSFNSASPDLWRRRILSACCAICCRHTSRRSAHRRRQRPSL